MFLLEARRRELLPKRIHICSHEFCQPENESALIRRGLLSERKTQDDIFVCKYGEIHQCSFSDCMAEGYCPISGMSDGHHYVKEYVPPAMPKLMPGKKTETYTKMEMVVETILFSNFRQKINEQWKRKQMKLCKKEKDSYIHENCADCPINLIGAMMIESVYRSQKPPLVVLEHDQVKIHYYTQVCQFIYQCIQRYVGENLNLDAIALGTLYKMQQGIRVEETVILPVDRFLVDHLPLINDLPQFKVDKRKFTRGEKLISQMIDNVKKLKVPLSEIALKLDRDETFSIFTPRPRSPTFIP